MKNDAKITSPNILELQWQKNQMKFPTTADLALSSFNLSRLCGEIWFETSMGPLLKILIRSGHVAKYDWKWAWEHLLTFYKILGKWKIFTLFSAPILDFSMATCWSLIHCRDMFYYHTSFLKKEKKRIFSEVPHLCIQPCHVFFWDSLWGRDSLLYFIPFKTKLKVSKTPGDLRPWFYFSTLTSVLIWFSTKLKFIL